MRVLACPFGVSECCVCDAGVRTENLTKEDEVDGAIIKDLMLEWITTVK
jgi:hypothetical protein